jgi:hypothetical protein
LMVRVLVASIPVGSVVISSTPMKSGHEISWMRIFYPVVSLSASSRLKIAPATIVSQPIRYHLLEKWDVVSNRGYWPSDFANFANVSGPLLVSAILIARLTPYHAGEKRRAQSRYEPEKCKLLKSLKHLRISIVLYHLPIGVFSNATTKTEKFCRETTVSRRMIPMARPVHCLA